jgi:hypothetical protein
MLASPLLPESLVWRHQAQILRCEFLGDQIQQFPDFWLDLLCPMLVSLLL